MNVVYASNSLLGMKAPIIIGKIIPGNGLLNLKKLMVEISREKDENGNFKEKDGKYIWKVNKNVVVLNFFSTSCIPCIKEIPTFNTVAKKFSAKNIKFVYVNVDPDVSYNEISRFIIRKNIQVPMILPNQKETIKNYNVYSLPRIIIIDRNQKITNIISGFEKSLENQLSEIIQSLMK